MYLYHARTYPDEIREICSLLEGLPLGIVIAAGQVKYLSPPEILATLRHDPLAFTNIYQDMPDRHRGFSSLIEATRKHLTDEEQRTLRALSIFRGSFRHEAALAVAAIDMQVFIQLVDKSLVQRVENFRYRMHGLLQNVFAVYLDEAGERETVRQRLTAYYTDWCREVYRQKTKHDDDIVRIDEEYANIWHLDWMTPQEQGHYLLNIIPALQKYWRNRGYTEQVATILQPALDDEQYPANLRARGMVELAAMLLVAGRHSQAESLCEQALATAPQNLYVQVDALQQLARLDMQRGHHQVAWGRLMTVLELEASRTAADDPLIDYLFIGNHNGIGLVAMKLDETDVARSHFNIAQNGWQRLGETLMQAQVRNNLALLDLRDEKYGAARQHFEAIIPLARAAKNDSALITYVGNLGKALMLLEEYAHAHTQLSESIQIALRLNQKQSILNQLETFAELAYRVKAYTIAAQLYGYLIQASENDDIPFWPVTVTKFRGYIETMRGELGLRYGQLDALGRKLSQDAAVALAQSLTAHLPPPSE